MSEAPANNTPKTPTADSAEEVPLEDLTTAELLESGKSQAARALATNSVTSMTYDVIADLVVRAARVLEPRLDDLCVVGPPGPAYLIENLPQYKQVDTTLLFDDPVRDLWDMGFMVEVVRAVTRMLAQASCPVKHTLRGQIIRRPFATKPARFMLVVSVLNCESPRIRKEPADGEQEREEGTGESGEASQS